MDVLQTLAPTKDRTVHNHSVVAAVPQVLSNKPVTTVATRHQTWGRCLTTDWRMSWRISWRMAEQPFESLWQVNYLLNDPPPV